MTEKKRLIQHAVRPFFVRKVHDLEFATVLKLGSNVAMLEHDFLVMLSHETIASKECSEVNRLCQSIIWCRTRSDIATQEKLDSCANMQKRKCQEDGRTDDAGKKSKEQDQKRFWIYN